MLLHLCWFIEGEIASFSYTVLAVLAATSAFLPLLVALVDIFIRGEASPDLQTSIES
ncbi:hypothetical protein ES319_D03G051300v1 [Gossypium barbadense]|uniref:Uncharacterized protein n=2 Tax=Gossypium TaxID=3633 RepID=A0A5J5S1S5_GOSBA|nr:hypothetical protein ES319_D03G051300v1 [Gossypium barbadense]TYG75737.1 hypothetical protein ES288_D03G056700v1 [Gossypium darwinii]